MKNYSIFLLSIAILGCTIDSEVNHSLDAPQVTEERKPNHTHPVFGGTLFGYDHGEFGGGLLFADRQNNTHRILDENIVGIYSSNSDIFVFTGISHLSITKGAIYKIDLNQKHFPLAQKIGKLSGKPYKIIPSKDKGIVFRVKNECYAINFEDAKKVNTCSPEQMSIEDVQSP